MEAGGRGVVVPNLRVAQLVEREIVEIVRSTTEFKYTIKNGGALPHHDYDDLNSEVDSTLACAYSKHTAVEIHF